jgi:4-hydroxy-tetrahydrodipicolinate synthase
VAADLHGVFAAVLTPLDAEGRPDVARQAGLCRWLLAHGCDGLSVLGTTGEANSFSVEERIDLLHRLTDAGIPGAALLPGTGCCAVPDTVRLTRAALAVGAARCLMLPPFYYKTVSDDGVFAAFAETIERVGDARLRVYLYHFPQLAGVPIGKALIERLYKAYPTTIAGMKDSSGDLGNMLDTARTFPGFAVLSGSDECLLPLLRAGGAGCITAVVNVAAPLAAAVVAAFRAGDDAAAEEAQARLTAARRAISVYPLTAALKEIMALHTNDSAWRHIRPPLMPLAADTAAVLAESLASLDIQPPAVG